MGVPSSSSTGPSSSSGTGASAVSDKDAFTKTLRSMILPDTSIDSLNKYRLGKGTYGHVERAKYKARGSTEWKTVAIKYTNDPKDQPILVKEAKMMYEMQNKHVIELYGLYECSMHGLGMVMEYMDCKSLHELVQNEHIDYTIDHVVSWMYQLSDAVQYFHSRNQLHRDLKLQNLLLKDRYRHLKVCDFGTFTRQRDTMQSIQGSPITMAPEIYRQEFYDSKCDIYSVGIIMWQALARKEPYMYYERTALLWNVAESGTRPPELKCDPILSRFYKRCWHANPKLRPTSVELVEYFSILLKFYPKGDEPLVDRATNEPARTPQPQMARPELPKNGHRRAGSDQSTLLHATNLPASPSGCQLSAAEAAAQRSNRSHSVAGLMRRTVSNRSITNQSITPTSTQEQPFNVMDHIDRHLRPPPPQQGNPYSEQLLNEHVAICHQQFDVEQEMRKKLAAKHELVMRLAELARYKRLLDRKKMLETMRDEGLKRIQQQS